MCVCSDLTLRFYHVASRTSANEETVKPRGAVRLPLPHSRLAWWAGAVLDGPQIGSRLCFLVGPRPAVSVVACRPFDPRPVPGQDRDKERPPSTTVMGSLEGHSDVVCDVLVLAQPREIVGPPRDARRGQEEDDALPRETGLLATASMDRTIKLWALPERTCACTLEGHAAGVRSLAYDRSQHMLLSAGFEYSIKAWGVSGRPARAGNRRTAA